MKKQLFAVLCLIGFIFIGQSGSAQDASATGISRAFNPAMSVNSLFYSLGSSRAAPLWQDLGLAPGLHYQEICMEMTSNVDVYLQSKAAFSATEEEGLEVEEAYVTTLQMPVPIVLRAGKMLNTFGRHNLYHLHHAAFAEPPMILNQVFGEGLNEVSIEASYLIPASWYSDFTVGVLNGDNPFLFASDKQNDFAYLAHWDNLWDLSDEIAFRLGGSFLTGKKGLFFQSTDLVPVTENILSRTWGIDFYLKWKPLQFGRYRSLILQGEYINTTLEINGKSGDPLHGFFVQALRQFKLRWWLQARFDWFNRSPEMHAYFPNPVELTYNKHQELSGKRISAALAYVPTEFGAYRLQYNWIALGDEYEQQVIFQLNITIGSHPAHKY